MFPGTLDDVSLDDFLFAINKVGKSYIRVEADEATYNMHIILRFELEQEDVLLVLVEGCQQRPARLQAHFQERLVSVFPFVGELGPDLDAFEERLIELLTQQGGPA